jgi:hypothetical protein
MKIIYIPFICLFFTVLGTAQSVKNFSMGPSYGSAQFYLLNNDQTTSCSHSNWDIAFSVYGMQDAAIHINEGSSYSGTPPKLYTIPNKTFSDVIQNADLGGQLQNDELSWSSGAFNSIKNPANFADYGWGSYNMTNYIVEGTALYAIELSNGNYKKLAIDSLAGGKYYFRYADFDGSNLLQKQIDKTNFPNQTLAYFSFSTNDTVTVEPSTGWDWVFTRYETKILNQGAVVDYPVGGILINRNVEAVIADNIDPSTVNASAYTTSSDSLSIIGYDWKNYGFTTGWTVDADRVYFVKNANDRLFKIQFIDFQGSSNGQGSFIKTDLGIVSSAVGLEKGADNNFTIFPNPAVDHLNVAFTLEQDNPSLSLEIIDVMGRIVWQQQTAGQAGLNGKIVNFSLESGNYFLRIKSDSFVQTKSFTINN